MPMTGDKALRSFAKEFDKAWRGKGASMRVHEVQELVHANRAGAFRYVQAMCEVNELLILVDLEQLQRAGLVSLAYLMEFKDDAPARMVKKRLRELGLENTKLEEWLDAALIAVTGQSS